MTESHWMVLCLGIELGMLIGAAFWQWLDEHFRKKEEKEKNKRD